MPDRSFLRFFRPRVVPVAAELVPPRAAALPQFPPHDVGIEVVPVERLLKDNEDLLQRIRLSYGCDEATYQRFIVEVVRRYARFVHLLPATPDNFFRERGGLLRMGLEIGFFSLQGTDGQIFGGRQTISQRVILEPRWRYATFLAGMLAEVHRALNQLIVIDDDGQAWPAYLGSLYDWATARRSGRYYLRWTQRARENRAPALFALSHVVPADLMDWLNQENSVVVPQLMASISGLPTYHDTSMIDQLVRRCVAVVIDTDLQSNADRYGRPLQGAHLERYLVDAMRRLVASSAWHVNAEKSRLWLGTDGLFLVWPGGANEIVRLLVEKDELPGIPRSPETLAEILVAAGAFEPAADGSAIWQIVPPEAQAALNAVKLSSPTILLSALPSVPVALAIALCRPFGMAVSPAATPSDEPPVMDVSASEAPLAKGQAQLELIAPKAASGPTSAKRAAAPAPAPAREAPQSFSLKAVPRLSPPVRRVLAEIVETMNGPGRSAACRSIREGLFIPLRAFEARSIEPSMAVRSLASAAMLVASRDGSRTWRAEFDREEVLGLVLKVAFVTGFDERDFAREEDAC